VNDAALVAVVVIGHVIIVYAVIVIDRGVVVVNAPATGRKNAEQKSQHEFQRTSRSIHIVLPPPKSFSDQPQREPLIER
jgi:hypothetical protein